MAEVEVSSLAGKRKLAELITDDDEGRPCHQKKQQVGPIDPLFVEDKSRFMLFPLRDREIWQMYKKHQSLFWITEEIDLSQDRKDWNSSKLSEDEKYFIKNVLAFFNSSDAIVNFNLARWMLATVTLPEVQTFYAWQMAMENIHTETYSSLIENLIADEEEKYQLFHAIETTPGVQKKAEWALRWISNSEATFAERLVAFAAVEGIFFSGSFCSIFWLKKRGLMPGLCQSNELISRDEGLHTLFACLLYRKLQPHNRLSQTTAHQIIGDAVTCEKFFVTQSLPVRLIGMNAELMTQYIEFVADQLLSLLGFEKIFHSENPFDWMELISLDGKTNFFERFVTEYQKPNDRRQVQRKFVTDVMC